MNTIIKTGKTLALISILHSRKAFFIIWDRTKVIMQVFFTTIELAEMPGFARVLGQSTEI